LTQHHLIDGAKEIVAARGASPDLIFWERFVASVEARLPSTAQCDNRRGILSSHSRCSVNPSRCFAHRRDRGRRYRNLP